MMTIDQFIASGTPCADLGPATGEDFLAGVSGRLYLNSFYITDRDGGYRLEIEGDEWDAPAEGLRGLEVTLFEWASDLGIVGE